MPRARHTRTILLPRGAQIEVEYNPRRPSIQTIVRQVEALGYWVVVRPRHHQPFYRDINNHSFTSQRVGTHLLFIYPPPFDPQQNETEIAREQNLQVNIESIEVEITEDLDEDGQVPPLEIDDEDSPFYGLTAIEYQGGDNRLAPEGIRGARGRRVHIIRRVSGGKERTPPRSNTQSKALRATPPKSSHKEYFARQRVVPP